MKIDNKTLQIMQSDISAVVNHLNLNPKDLNVYDLNNIWFATWCNRTYADDHVMVIKNNGKRLLSFIDRDNYDLYPCDTNDTTIFTALNKILKNLQS